MIDLSRTRARLAKTNRGAASRLALSELLRKAGYDVGVTAIHQWPRKLQGDAYLWAVARIAGREDIPPPWVAFREAM